MSGAETVLVTGGAGYVGSHACKSLAAAGFLPVTYDDLSRGHEEAVRWGPLERGDIGDGDRLEAVMKQYKPQAVMHFAGLIEVGESVVNPALFYQTNVGGMLALLGAMDRAGVPMPAGDGTYEPHPEAGTDLFAADVARRGGGAS